MGTNFEPKISRDALDRIEAAGRVYKTLRNLAGGGFGLTALMLALRITNGDEPKFVPACTTIALFILWRMMSQRAKSAKKKAQNREFQQELDRMAAQITKQTIPQKHF